MNQNSSLGQDHALFEKSIIELMNSNPNFSLPLSYEKFLWTVSNDPMRYYEQLQYYPLHYLPASGNNNVINFGENPTEMQFLGTSDTNTNNKDSFFYSHGTEHLKVVSLCDKTLALLDYGNPASNQLLRCELFDLEKNLETAYTEAKKTGIPIQSVSFREMREIINACRVLAEAEFSPNTVSVGSPPPPIPISSSPVHDFTLTSSTSGSNTNTASNTGIVSSMQSIVNNLIASSPSNDTTSSPNPLESSQGNSSTQAVQQSNPSSVSIAPPSPSDSSSVSSPPPPTSSLSDKGSSLWSSWRALLPGNSFFICLKQL